MTFFDTNVLIYFSINQDIRKQNVAQILIQEAIEKQKFIISPLVMIEFIFVLSKNLSERLKESLRKIGNFRTILSARLVAVPIRQQLDAMQNEMDD